MVINFIIHSILIKQFFFSKSNNLIAIYRFHTFLQEALKNKAEEMQKRNDKLVEHLEEVMRRYESMKNEKKSIEAQNIADIKKLQEDTIKWKEK